MLAFFQALNGKYDGWIDLQKEQENQTRRRLEKKKKEKEKERRKIVSEIQKSLAEKNAEAKNKNNHSTHKAKQSQTSQVAKHHTYRVAQHISSYQYAQGDGSDKQKKEAKKKRHQKNERMRQKQREQSQHEQSIKQTETNSKRKPMNDSAPSKVHTSVKLSTFYKFGKVALNVDAQIEQGIWRITREQLRNYFECMGCIYLNGRGSHQKVKLPKSMQIMHGRKLIALIPEEGSGGGSLILPTWTKGYIPDYLRSQILSAREYLKNFAQKAKSQI